MLKKAVTIKFYVTFGNARLWKIPRYGYNEKN